MKGDKIGFRDEVEYKEEDKDEDNIEEEEIQRREKNVPTEEELDAEDDDVASVIEVDDSDDFNLQLSDSDEVENGQNNKEAANESEDKCLKSIRSAKKISKQVLVKEEPTLEKRTEKVVKQTATTKEEALLNNQHPEKEMNENNTKRLRKTRCWVIAHQDRRKKGDITVKEEPTEDNIPQIQTKKVNILKKSKISIPITGISQFNADVKSEDGAAPEITTQERIYVTAKTLYCEDCSFKTTSKIAIKKHIKSKHPAVFNLGKVHCELCDHKAGSKAGMTHHRRKRHGIEPPTEFPCNICGDILTSAGHLKRHKNLKHENNPERFQCEVCDVTFSLKASMKKHMEKVHKERRPYELDNMWSCDLCSFQTFSLKPKIGKLNLARHMKNNHAKIEEQIQEVIVEVQEQEQLEQQQGQEQQLELNLNQEEQELELYLNQEEQELVMDLNQEEQELQQEQELI